jgi:NAD(P)-dependent dehydrogenase (short-subunit alcohol dehydrogenase family)
MAEGDKPVWFITGCSTGFGRQLARHALDRGYRVVVTARKPADIADLAEGRALIEPLDVTRPQDIAAAVTAAQATFRQHVWTEGPCYQSCLTVSRTVCEKGSLAGLATTRS